MFLVSLFMVSEGRFGTISVPKLHQKSDAKLTRAKKVATCVPIDKYHIELKVGPLKVGLKSIKKVIKHQVESKSHFRDNFLATFCDLWCPLGSLWEAVGLIFGIKFRSNI